MTINVETISLYGSRKKEAVCVIGKEYLLDVLTDEKGELLVVFKPVSPDEAYVLFIRRRLDSRELRSRYTVEKAEKVSREQINAVCSKIDLSSRLWGYRRFRWQDE